MWSSLFNYIIILLSVLLNIAFFTLLERKVLGLSQYRKGPNKVAVWGLLQPFADAVKLFSKEMVYPFMVNKMSYLVGPILSMICMLFLWSTVSLSFTYLDQEFSVLFVLTVLTLGSYPLILMGWSSNSKYALIGALRGVAQTISYEISFAIIFLNILFLGGSLNIKILVDNSMWFNSILFLVPLLLVWLISCVAESNRTPFDFSEGESELVSGFNIEYASFSFAIIFMSEYGMILFMSMLTTSIFLGLSLGFISALMICILSFWWVWIRCTYPRYRYDKLMNLAWKSLLPLSLGFLVYYLMFI